MLKTRQEDAVPQLILWCFSDISQQKSTS